MQQTGPHVHVFNVERPNDRPNHLPGSGRQEYYAHYAAAATEYADCVIVKCMTPQ